MKLDFLGFGGGKPIPRNVIEQYMEEKFGQRPLDDASGTIRTGVIAAGIFFGVLMLFALLVPISGAAVATGEVSVSGNRLVIQPSASGIVSQILVREGQQVQAGQPLVRFDGIRNVATLQQAQARYDILRATEARLTAERDGAAQLLFPTDLASRFTDPIAVGAMRAQAAIFQRRSTLLGAERAIAEAQLTAVEAQRSGARQQLALVNDELEGIRGLYAKGFARKSTLRALERSAVQLRTQELTGDTDVAKAQLALQQVRDTQAMQTVSQLASVQEQLAQVRPQLDVSRYTANRDVLRAPAAGRIAGVAQVGPGSVVSSGRTLMELVPTGRSFIVEAQIKPQDIDDVRVGSEAFVRFSSINPRGRTSFTGRVVTLSPARVSGEGGSAAGPAGYYRAQIALDDPASLTREGVMLQPGIPATINIKTHDRTLMDYLLAPLADAVSGGFREE